jgi:carbon-monoxide dehydrogenase iron sulfur subunit
MTMVCQRCTDASCTAGIDAMIDRVIKCDLCEGDPQSVRFCFPGALEFVDANGVNLRKKRVAATKLAELTSRVVAA